MSEKARLAPMSEEAMERSCDVGGMMLLVTDCSETREQVGETSALMCCAPGDALCGRRFRSIFLMCPVDPEWERETLMTRLMPDGRILRVYE